MDQQQFSTLIPDQIADYSQDSFLAVPRDSDTAVVYWSLSGRKLPYHESGRLCLQVIGQTSDVVETIILNREAGHFIVPLVASERHYEFQLGWSEPGGFTKLFAKEIELPDLPGQSLGANSTSIDYRGSVFWAQHAPSAN